MGAFSAGLVVVLFTKRLARLLGNGDAALGWQLTMVIWGALASVLFVTAFLSTRG